MKTFAPLFAAILMLTACTSIYTNPVLCADYSDPDVCVDGDDYYLTASSFADTPGLPVLHSRNLVNWEIIAYALPRIDPAGWISGQPTDEFDTPQHGNGVWAPSIRLHDGLFRIYWGDPDYGIFVTTAERPEGPWSTPQCVIEGKGLIDPCPLWDDDGRCYLVHGWAKSRAGFNNILTVRELNADGTKAIGDSVTVFRGGEENRTTEGPKFYKRDGWYWIWCPSGGVKEGWQLAMRSRSPYGPYEWKRVMDQGGTDIHGPHQGGWVHTAKGEDWFLHFEDRYAYGRVVHLQPVRWNSEGWPVVGNDPDGDGCGEPVLRYRKPKSVRWRKVSPAESDGFTDGYGLQWQWPANPKPGYFEAREGFLRLNGAPCENLREAPNLLLQKLPAMSFTATAKVQPEATEQGYSGLVMMGSDFQALALSRTGDAYCIGLLTCLKADQGGEQVFEALAEIPAGLPVWLRLSVADSFCSFSWSTDGKNFTASGAEPFAMKAGRWIGAKMGLFCTSGHLDASSFAVSPKPSSREKHRAMPKMG